MKFEENVKDFLKVIDFDLCIVDEKSVTIHDKHNEESLNYILNFPIGFTSDDNLRVFRCNESNKNYTMEIMNIKDPKHQFIKNGIEMFRLMWSNGMFPFKEDDIKNKQIFQGPMRILKRSDAEKIKHMKKMIRKDFEEN